MGNLTTEEYKQAVQPVVRGNHYGMSDHEFTIVMRAKRRAGYNEAIDDALRIFSEFEPHMKLNLDIRNDFVDRLSALKEDKDE